MHQADANDALALDLTSCVRNWAGVVLACLEQT